MVQEFKVSQEEVLSKDKLEIGKKIDFMFERRNEREALYFGFFKNKFSLSYKYFLFSFCRICLIYKEKYTCIQAFFLCIYSDTYIGVFIVYSIFDKINF